MSRWAAYLTEFQTAADCSAVLGLDGSHCGDLGRWDVTPQEDSLYLLMIRDTPNAAYCPLLVSSNPAVRRVQPRAPQSGCHGIEQVSILKRRDGTTFLDINDAKIYQSPGFREI
jgi:hypothetical protein